MENIMYYLLTRKIEVLAESGENNHGYHNQGHLDVINEIEEEIKNGADEIALDKFACNEIEKSKNVIAKEEEKYWKLSREDKKAYNFTPDYFIADGRMCQCIELQTFMEEEEEEE